MGLEGVLHVTHGACRAELGLDIEEVGELGRALDGGPGGDRAGPLREGGPELDDGAPRGRRWRRPGRVELGAGRWAGRAGQRVLGAGERSGGYFQIFFQKWQPQVTGIGTDGAKKGSFGARRTREPTGERTCQRYALVTAALIATSCMAAPLLGQASFTGIGFLPGGGPLSTSWTEAVSPDGSVVVGRGYRGPPSSNVESARWTRAGGIQGMGLPSGVHFSTGTAASLGGSFICGYHEASASTIGPTAGAAGSAAYQDLGLVPGFGNSFAQDISRDGKVVVGFRAHRHRGQRAGLHLARRHRDGEHGRSARRRGQQRGAGHLR